MITKILKTLKNADQIGILSHIHPDGDALGSQLALARGLQDWGKTPVCYNMSHLPTNLVFLPGYEAIVTADTETSWPDLVISVDCGSLERCGLSKRPQAIKTWINIDHHAGNTLFGDINYVCSDAAATCEMIARFFGNKAMPMSPEVATCLFTGLSTDTGSFKYANTSKNTFALAAKLKEAGADTDSVRLHVYESMGRGKFAMMQALFAKTKFLAEGRIAVTGISYAEAESLSPGETGFSGIVAQLKEIQGVEIAMLTRELADGSVKASFRSKSYFDCNRFAQTLGGGGHARAAGVTLQGSFAKVHENLENALVQTVDEL